PSLQNTDTLGKGVRLAHRLSPGTFRAIDASVARLAFNLSRRSLGTAKPTRLHQGKLTVMSEIPKSPAGDYEVRRAKMPPGYADLSSD
ncbi:MAG: hypothetical protein AAF493_23690, partial [Pseudomonadota bacterium]